MFKNLGKIKYKVSSEKVKIGLDQINEGVNYTEEFIIYKKKKNCLFMIEFVTIMVGN